MDINEAALAFDALSQETRLKAYRLLVESGSHGVPAGVLSEALGVPNNTLSFHLSHLSNAGLVTSQREGRSIIYRANHGFTHNLIKFLVEKCCAERFANIKESKCGQMSVIEMSKYCQCQSEKEKNHG